MLMPVQWAGSGLVYQQPIDNMYPASLWSVEQRLEKYECGKSVQIKRQNKQLVDGVLDFVIFVDQFGGSFQIMALTMEEWCVSDAHSCVCLQCACVFACLLWNILFHAGAFVCASVYAYVFVCEWVSERMRSRLCVFLGVILSYFGCSFVFRINTPFYNTFNNPNQIQTRNFYIKPNATFLIFSLNCTWTLARAQFHSFGQLKPEPWKPFIEWTILLAKLEDE